VLERSAPHLVLLDGAAATETSTRMLRRTLRSAAALVVFDGPRSPDEQLALLEDGISGFVSLSMPPNHVEALLTAVASGHLVVPRNLTFTVGRRDAAPARGMQLGRHSPLEGLTPQETKILRLLAQGMSNKALAARLSISSATVKTHVHSILGKLGVHNRGQAAALWRDHQMRSLDHGLRR
jgi:DNA-binding NarL/FixJ family response regulator